MSRRFNVKESLEKLYTEIPKALLFEPKYKGDKEKGIKPLSNDAKVLYSILLDRTYLSLHNATENQDNRFIDEKGDIFIYFDNTSIQEILNVSCKKAIAIKKELVSYNLLEEIQQGLNKTNRLYLNTVQTNKNNLKLYTSDFQKVVNHKKEAEKDRISKIRKDKKDNPESIENTRYCKNDSTGTVNLTVPVLSNLQSSNTEVSKTDFSNTDLKSVVVLLNGKEIKINDKFRLIQLDQNKTIDEKIKLLNEIEYINENTKALLYNFIKYNILVSQQQAKMLNECVYDVALESLNTTISQDGKVFSYFYQVYKSKEEEDSANILNDFVFKPNHKI